MTRGKSVCLLDEHRQISQILDIDSRLRAYAVVVTPKNVLSSRLSISRKQSNVLGVSSLHFVFIIKFINAFQAASYA